LYRLNNPPSFVSAVYKFSMRFSGPVTKSFLCPSLRDSRDFAHLLWILRRSKAAPFAQPLLRQCFQPFIQPPCPP
jgi:hypothetical protein